MYFKYFVCKYYIYIIFLDDYKKNIYFYCTFIIKQINEYFEFILNVLFIQKNFIIIYKRKENLITLNL